MLLAPMPPLERPAAGARAHVLALLSWALRIGDLIAIVAAGILAYWLRFDSLAPTLDYERHLARGLLFALLVFIVSPLYRSWRGRGMAGELWTMLGAYSAMFALSIVFATALKLTDEISRLWWAWWFLSAVMLGTGLRILVRGAAGWARRRGVDVRTAVIVGTARDAARVADSLRRQPWAGIELLGWFESYASVGEVPGLPRLGPHVGIGGFVETVPVNQVWLALPMGAQDEICMVLDQLAHSTADIKFVPDMMGMRLLNHSVEQLAGMPVINLQQTPLRDDGRLLKALEDRVLSFLILLAISPLMLAIAVAVKLSSPGPVFYRQERVSWNNRRFGMLKFRSMPVNAEAASGPKWAQPGENRATRVGAFLRKTSLDELPQFINVLLGDMSIVGPRPERPVFVEQFKHQIPTYMKKHLVKAGITGWAQVNGWRGDTDLTRRIECDLYYIENWSVMFDLKIIWQTLFKGFVHKNAY